MKAAILATLAWTTLAATSGLAQEAKNGSVVPPNEKMFIAEAESQNVKLIGWIQTKRGKRIQLSLNGTTYEVIELLIKTKQFYQMFSADALIPLQLPLK